MKNWIENLREKSFDFKALPESMILSELPSELSEDWENFMRGKTCPILDNGEHGVYCWDLEQFLDEYV